MIIMTVRMLLISSIFVLLALFASGLESKEFQKRPLLKQAVQTLQVQPKIAPRKFKNFKPKKVAQSEEVRRHNGHRRGIFLIPQWESFCQPGLTSVDQFANLDQIRAFTNDLQTWIQEVSLHHLDVAWDIFGPFSVAYPQECLNINGLRMVTQVMLSAEAYYSPNLNICNYDYVMVYPAFISQGGATGVQEVLSIGSCNKVFSVTLFPWENYVQTIADEYTQRHEFGHSLGLNHAWSWDCSGVTARHDGAGCTGHEYGNLFDIMGTGGGHFNAAYKEFLGWATTRMIDATDGATYEIRALETVSDSPKALKMNLGEEFGELYIEYRSPTGISLPDFSVAGGLVLDRVVYIGEGQSQRSSPTSFLLDCTPRDPSIAYSSAYFLDAMILPGQTCDTNLGFTITFTSATETRATVRIDYLGP